MVIFKHLVFLGLLLTAISALSEDSPWFVPGSLEVDKHDIEFEAEDGAVLSGTLRVPHGLTNGPAVVIPQQTQTHYRDNPLYLQTAEVFNAIGFSSFVYDRRGKGESGGDMPQTDYFLLARDAVAAKQAIGETEFVNDQQIGYWGISQSGWISMEAAAKSNAAFVVVVASPLTTPGEQMKFYTRNLVLIHGHGKEAADQAAALWHAIMDEYMRGEIEHDVARQLLSDAEEEAWFSQVGMVTAENLPEDVSKSGWINEIDYDPTNAWERVDAPILFLHGGKDWIVPVAETMTILETLEPAGEREVHVIDSADHTMIIRDEIRILTDEEVEEMSVRDFNPDSEIYFMLMGRWLGQLWQDS
ncbi:alpha/beta hydrolase [Wenzhouxiangella sp. AB-CW3]|uniref:alpha/beta hydrolase n=1 Tax=Wenzhouxiangella sp. AB-CW3 TaxID=2771012 RepID=UPI00168AA223|nr:alpha/beta hydrolase [Wenzhouxiangella sp. AB-CW3]QOC24065.1 alpha/beta hydrolase [Wenzhouxiangella sp. AB-CW3]